jgi:hypothetical protein
MDNPDIYMVINKNELPTSEDDYECGSNLEWIIEQAKRRVREHCSQVVYKLVPVMEISLEVTTKVITKDLSQP